MKRSGLKSILAAVLGAAILAVPAGAAELTFRDVPEDAWYYADVQSAVEEAVSAYLLELRQAWKDQDLTVVRISQIESRILDLPEVVDITGTDGARRPSARRRT